jgi:hypothetical protein
MSDSTPTTECTVPQPGPSAEHGRRADESLSRLSGYLGFEGLEAAHGVDGGRKAGVRRDLDETAGQRRSDR